MMFVVFLMMDVMHIFVKTRFKLMPITLDVHVNDTLEELKDKIRERGIPTHGMKLMVELEPGRTRQS